jgi:hypothetical protein
MAMPIGADRRDRTRDGEQRDRNHARAPARQAERPRRQRLERAIRLGDREEERDAGERQEERDGEAGHDRVGPEPRGIDADNPREGQRQPSHVDAGDHRQAERDDERDEREDGWIHVSSRPLV